MNVIEKNLRKVDDYQQRRRWLAFPFAVVKKFGDDRAGHLAALIAYYGFFSIFPLLLVLVSILGFVLHGNPELQRKIEDTALAQFPVIGDQIRKNVSALTSGAALGIGTITALWAGMGVTQAAQTAMNEIWDVPIKSRPNFIQSRVRGLLLLILLGAITLVSTVLSGLGTFEGTLGVALRILGFGGSLFLNLILFLIAFRVLTNRDVSWGEVFPGAVVGAVLWALLQAGGSYYMNHQVKHASEVYGLFGFVLGLLAWIYLGSQLTLIAAEVNVVKVKGLWPRSIVQPPMTEGDAKTLEQAAKVEERMPEEEVRVSFDPETQVEEAPTGASQTTSTERSSTATAPPPKRKEADKSDGSVSKAVGVGALGAIVAAGATTAWRSIKRRRNH